MLFGFMDNYDNCRGLGGNLGLEQIISKSIGTVMLFGFMDNYLYGFFVWYWSERLFFNLLLRRKGLFLLGRRFVPC